MLLYTTAVRRRRPRPACVTVGSRGSASSLWNGHNPFQACVLRARPIFEGRPPVPHGPRASRWDNSSRQRVLGCLKSTAHELRRSEHLLCCFIPRGTSAYLSYVILRTPEDSIPHEYIYIHVYICGQLRTLTAHLKIAKIREPSRPQIGIRSPPVTGP